VTKLNLNELGAADGFSILIAQDSDLALRPRIKHVRRVTPCIAAIETEIHPAMASDAEFNMALGNRRHLTGIEHEQFSPILIADPKLPSIRGQCGTVSPVLNRALAGEDPMNRSPFLKINHVESHVFAQAHVGEPLSSIDGEWKDSEFTDVWDLSDPLLILGCRSP
jgi:hypothetical protein